MRPAAGDGWTRSRRLTAFAFAVLGVLILVAELEGLSQDPLSDVRAYYDAGARLNAGEPLYPPNADVNAAGFYRYPPLLALLFRPLALLPYGVAAVLWELALIAAFLLTLRRLASRPGFVTALAILAFPIAWSLAIGQAQVLVTYLLTAASPFTVALAGQLKVFPALAAIYWVGVRDWRFVRQFIAWTAALVLLQVVLEPRGSGDFLAITNLNEVGHVNNLSIYVISPALWLALCVAAAIGVLLVARTRYGWPAAVAFSVLATPRLLAYLLMALLAGLRRSPTVADVEPAAGGGPRGRIRSVRAAIVGRPE